MVFAKRPLEFYTFAPEQHLTQEEWTRILQDEQCSYLGRRCTKIRKSQPDRTIGTCTVGFRDAALIICPNRFLQRRQIFIDAIHLLDHHTPGNQLHVVPEVDIPGGSVDYFVVSIRQGVVQDYVAIELQAVDTTGSVWPARQEFVENYIAPLTNNEEVRSTASYGINWKMTAKTTLMQMHHKAGTLELLGKKIGFGTPRCTLLIYRRRIRDRTSGSSQSRKLSTLPCLYNESGCRW